MFAIDPGGVSGAACGVFEGGLGSVAETLRSAVESGLVEAWEVEGEPWMQAWELAPEIAARVYEWNLGGIALCDIWIVFEQFALRQRSADLAPVAVTAATKALLLGRAEMLSVAGWQGAWLGGVGVVEQGPGDAKHLGTRPRMEDWGVWTLGRGSEHKRDALRHLALRVALVLGSDA